MQTNEAGEVAIKYHQPIQVIASGYPYVFVPKANISMAWVKAGDVGGLLKIKGGCCGGKKQKFNYANEDDVRRWTNGGGR